MYDWVWGRLSNWHHDRKEMSTSLIVKLLLFARFLVELDRFVMTSG